MRTYCKTLLIELTARSSQFQISMNFPNRNLRKFSFIVVILKYITHVANLLNDLTTLFNCTFARQLKKQSFVS